MSINAVGSSQILPPVPTQATIPPDSSVVQTLASENPPPVKLPSSEPPPFYTYREKPWLTQSEYKHITCRKEYVRQQEAWSLLKLSYIQRTYDSFRKHLVDIKPELAKNNFGFTLDADANLKIIGYGDSLTENDRSALSGLINNFESLKIVVQDHAKIIMTLADHDHEAFGSRRNISLENFQDIVDYHKVLSRSPDAMQDEWIRQVQNNAEPEGPTYISIYA